MSELTRRRESTHLSPHQATWETRPRRSRSTTDGAPLRQIRISINDLSAAARRLRQRRMVDGLHPRRHS